MHDFLEMANGGQHGQNGFDNHAFIVAEWLTHLQIGRIALFGMEAMIGKDHRAIFDALDQRVKDGVMNIRCITTPIDHLTEMVEQEAELAAHNPASVGIPLLANLLLRTAFAHRMDQFNPVAINDTQQVGVRKQLVQI